MDFMIEDLEYQKGDKTTPTPITDLTLVAATTKTDNNKDFETEFKTISHLQTDGKAGELDELPVEIESLVGKKALFMVTEPISELNNMENPIAEISSSRKPVKASPIDSHKKKIHFVDVNDDESSASTNDSHMKTGDSIDLNDDDTLNKGLINVRNKKCRKVVKK
ncbi:hypothetical protein C2S53_003306 [Perilla frutescens var. hirtella]|uniref:Uncharacterized protein n=1 Tax=Perilla frutescens var. hirtella TaxID=608512 RepID=A0AAD4JQZ7_PERFH|nr:hypothetical protein C2S53_003306 [Perilla frutescens var. hirtella]